MRHLFLLILLVIVVYAAWQIMPVQARRSARREITQHGLRLGALILVVVALAAAAYYLPTSSLLQ